MQSIQQPLNRSATTNGHRRIMDSPRGLRKTSSLSRVFPLLSRQRELMHICEWIRSSTHNRDELWVRMKDHVKKYPKCVKDAKLLDDENTRVPLLLWIFLQRAPLDVFKTLIAADQRMGVKRLGRDHLSRIFIQTIRDLEREDDASTATSLPALSLLVEAYPYALTGQDHQLETILHGTFFHNNSAVRKNMIPIIHKTLRREDMENLIGFGGCVSDWGQTFPHDVICHLTDEVLQNGRIDRIKLDVTLSLGNGRKPLNLSVVGTVLEATVYHDSFASALTELNKCSIPLVSICSANDLADAHDVLRAQTFMVPPHIVLNHVASIEIACSFTKVKELNSFLQMLKCMPNLTRVSLSLKFGVFEKEDEHDSESHTASLEGQDDQSDFVGDELQETASSLVIPHDGTSKTPSEEQTLNCFLASLAQSPLQDLELRFLGSVPVHGVARLLKLSKTLHTLRVCDALPIADIEPIAEAVASNTALEVLELQGSYDAEPLLRALSDSNFTLLQFYGDRPDERLDHCCQLNQMGRGRLRIEKEARRSTTQRVVVKDVLLEAAAYGTLSTLYSLLRFRPDLWATCEDNKNDVA